MRKMKAFWFTSIIESSEFNVPDYWEHVDVAAAERIAREAGRSFVGKHEAVYLPKELPPRTLSPKEQTDQDLSDLYAEIRERAKTSPEAWFMPSGRKGRAKKQPDFTKSPLYRPLGGLVEPEVTYKPSGKKRRKQKKARKK